MNVHDSEHMAGMLEQAGYVAASPATRPRRTPTSSSSTRARSGRTRPTSSTATWAGSPRTKRARPGMQIAVGGCLAQKDRAGIVERAPWVDVVFGTHNLDVLPVLLERARHNAEAQVEIEESLKVFPRTLPTRRESVYAGWVSISVGCNNTCTFCIVPAPARQGARPPAGGDPRRGRGARLAGCHRGDAARTERELLRRRVR